MFVIKIFPYIKSSKKINNNDEFYVAVFTTNNCINHTLIEFTIFFDAISKTHLAFIIGSKETI